MLGFSWILLGESWRSLLTDPLLEADILKDGRVCRETWVIASLLGGVKVQVLSLVLGIFCPYCS